MITELILKEGLLRLDDIKPGEIQKSIQDGVEHWLLGCPGCGMILEVREWNPTLNDKKEITLTPSLIHTKIKDNGCGIHITVNNSKITYL